MEIIAKRWRKMSTAEIFHNIFLNQRHAQQLMNILCTFTISIIKIGMDQCTFRLMYSHAENCFDSFLGSRTVIRKLGIIPSEILGDVSHRRNPCFQRMNTGIKGCRRTDHVIPKMNLRATHRGKFVPVTLIGKIQSSMRCMIISELFWKSHTWIN